MDYQVDVSELLQLPAIFARGPLVVRREMTTALEHGIKAVQDLARRIVKRDTGRLAASITGRTESLAGVITGLVGSNLPYAEAVERGRRAGAPMPPADALVGWLGRHGIPGSAEFVIRRAIGRRGIPPAPYLTRALRELRGRIADEFAAATARIADSLGRGR